MLETNTEIDYADFDKNKLVQGTQNLIIYDEEEKVKASTVTGYYLPGYDSFELRKHGNHWILSIGGRLVTYGSYNHIVEVIILLVTTFACWDSKASLTYFLQLPEHASVIDRIITLRSYDHAKKENYSESKTYR